MSSNSETNLDAPGAGLPLPELLIARARFAFKCRRGNRESFLESFCQERDQIHGLVASVEESKRGEQILIKRLRGLEDSSRNWSIWMTLDHLRITNAAFGDFVSSLVEGRTPGRKADTAAVKPDPNVTFAVEQSFEDSCDTVLKIGEKTADLKTEIRHAHPWFGPMNAFQWLGLASMHMGIHRAQTERIIANQ